MAGNIVDGFQNLSSVIPFLRMTSTSFFLSPLWRYVSSIGLIGVQDNCFENYFSSNSYIRGEDAGYKIQDTRYRLASCILM